MKSETNLFSSLPLGIPRHAGVLQLKVKTSWVLGNVWTDFRS